MKPPKAGALSCIVNSVLNMSIYTSAPNGPAHGPPWAESVFKFAGKEYWVEQFFDVIR